MLYIYKERHRYPLKVGISGHGNLQTMCMDKWATSKSTQLSTKIFGQTAPSA